MNMVMMGFKMIIIMMQINVIKMRKWRYCPPPLQSHFDMSSLKISDKMDCL